GERGCQAEEGDLQVMAWLCGTPEAADSYQQLTEISPPLLTFFFCYDLLCLSGSLHISAFLAAIPSQVVFCHDDMSPCNILLLQDGDHSPRERLMLIDFEQSRYNYRGFEFGNHFCEWINDYAYDQWPFFKAIPENYPNREQQVRLWAKRQIHSSFETIFAHWPFSLAIGLLMFFSVLSLPIPLYLQCCIHYIYKRKYHINIFYDPCDD
uniref:ethanolamine kinase n=1 Tax=Mola mola TaxID=94237 RepID=A0A3Q4BDT0_MOLML